MHRCRDPRSSTLRSSPRRPEDWPRLFEQHLNAGDLEPVVALMNSTPDSCRQLAKSLSAATGFATWHPSRLQHPGRIDYFQSIWVSLNRCRLVLKPLNSRSSAARLLRDTL